MMREPAIRLQLPAMDLREIDSSFSTIEVHSGRMHEEQMNLVDQTQ
jgi:hypothetical protein